MILVALIAFIILLTTNVIMAIELSKARHRLEIEAIQLEEISLYLGSESDIHSKRLDEIEEKILNI